MKKLAAIATGAALLGTAAAPMVAAIDIKKSDIFDSATGAPIVNIVVGSDAQVSDGIWAGNLAAKIASKAGTSKTVDVKVNADANGGTGASGSVNLADLTIDVTVGGTVSISSSSSYRFKGRLDSQTGSTSAPEISTGNDTNVLKSGQLSYLHNAAVKQKVDNNATNPTIEERIGVVADAKQNTTGSGVKDLFATISGGQFYYESIINGTTGLDMGNTSFTSGSNDSVKLILFGEQYELSSATLNGANPNVTLVKSAAKVTKFEGDTIDGLEGDGAYAGQAVSVKFISLTSTGPTATYEAKFDLIDSKGTVITSQSGVTSTANNNNLRDLFTKNGDAVLKSNLFVNNIGRAESTQQGYIDVTAGTDTLVLYHNKGYPYDSTSTASSFPYLVTITSPGNFLQKIRIANDTDKWTTDTTSLGPLYPSNAGDSLTGHAGTSALFGQSLPAGTLGKGFAKVEFLGFEGKESRAQILIGRDAGILNGLDGSARAYGGIKFKGKDEADHTLPFAVAEDSTAPTDTTVPGRNHGEFTFDGKTIYWDQNFGSTGSGKLDLNFVVNSSDRINGRIWTLTNAAGTDAADGNLQITVEGVGLMRRQGPDTPSAADFNLVVGSVFNVDGVRYHVYDQNVVSTTHDAGINVDGEIILTKTSAYTSTDTVANQASKLIYNKGGDTTDQSYGKLYFTQDAVFDGNSVGTTPVSVNAGLSGTSDSRLFYYAVAPRSSKLWFLMSADTLGSSESNVVQYDKAIKYLGTTYPTDSSYTEVAGLPATFADGDGAQDGNLMGRATNTDGTARDVGVFVPPSTDFNGGAAFNNSNAYFVSEFRIADAVSRGGISVFVNNANGGSLGSFPNNNLTGYATNVDYNGAPTWSLTNGSNTSYLQAAYTDAGTKVKLDGTDTGTTISSPQNAEDVILYVYGRDANKVVSGGSPVTLKAIAGESAKTSAGATVTVTGVHGGTCSVTGGKPAAAVCSATPASAFTPANVANLVYVDTDAPAGHNIVIGGQIVNKLASKLKDRLTSPSSPVIAEVDASGNIWLAGYTAKQTGEAVQELIDAIDALD
ncbi:MAG: S-layer protein [Candidatus Diapherotrites archaeon]|uniref:S-layer protein n=1 Tax=Candidatus Iainarchaeum sp. TaxID=3101447 RepID=A0A8T3YLS4_9ARCH|nr:S-layer protein [Candidatus Diapherotrites archaeon]